MLKTSNILLTYNYLGFTKKCLEILLKYTIWDKDNILTIIDNNSDDGTQEYLQTIDWADIILNHRNYSINEAWNQGIKRLEAEYYILLQNDIEVIPNWRNILINTANLDPQIGIVTLDDFKNNPSLFYREDPSIPKEVEWIGFVATLFKKEMVDQIGYLDEDFDICDCEDVEYCGRARFFGWKVYLAPYYIKHEGMVAKKNRASGWDLVRKKMELLRDKYKKDSL